MGQALSLFAMEDVWSFAPEILGAGNYGEVKPLLCNGSPTKYCAKILRQVGNSNMFACLQEEYKAMRALYPHKNIMSFQVAKVEELYCLVMERADGSLYDMISEMKGKSTIVPPVLMSILLDLFRAVEHAHSVGYIHRDIKPENLLWFPWNSTAKLSDFGFAKALTDSRGTICGTRDYMAPEMIRGRAYSFPVDIYSCGKVVSDLLEICGDLPLRNWLADFANDCVQNSPRRRPTATECVRKLEEFQKRHEDLNSYIGGYKITKEKIQTLQEKLNSLSLEMRDIEQEMHALKQDHRTWRRMIRRVTKE